MTRRNVKAGYNHQSGFGLDAFSPDEIKSIHLGTLHVFQNTGIKVEHQEAVEILAGAGARVEKHDDYAIVKIPNYVVEDCLRKVPKTVTYYGRRPEDDFVAEDKRLGFTAGFGESINVIDLDTRQVRSSTKEDLATVTRIQDYLDVITIVERAVCSGDQMPAAQSVHNYHAMVKNSSKHCFLGMGGGDNAKKIIEIAKIAAGGEKAFLERPIVTGFVCPTSPLSLVEDCCSSIIECARGGVGISVIPMSLSGASSAASLASVVVQHNVEVLSAFILAQLVNPGTPCTYAGCSTIMDLRLATSPVGVPELALLSVATAKMAQFYQVPSLVGGCASDSKIPDAQQAYDFSLTTIPAALAGANTIFGVGAIESILTFDYAAMITGAEQAERIVRLVGGIDVNDETMALDLIHEVGPGGHFISHKHTFDHMKEMSQAKLFDRKTRDRWQLETGGKSVSELAYKEAKRIADTHVPLALPDGAEKEMDDLIKAYEEQLKG